MGEPKTYELFRSTVRSASHLELRDTYTPDDPDWLQWRSGQRFNPAERWAEWFGLMKATTARGVEVRRLRVVSEPVTDYIMFEYDVTDDTISPPGNRSDGCRGTTRRVCCCHQPTSGCSTGQSSC